MSSNKMSSKAKVASFKRDVEPDKDDGNLDLSIIRKPPPDKVSGFSHLQKLYNSGTIELKEILSTECEYLYECKVCRNIFRSIIHLITHKRVYCKDKFNPSKHANFIKTMSLASELIKLRELELLITDMEEENKKIEKDAQIPMTKDLTEIIEKLTVQKGVSINKINNEVQQVTLQNIPTSKHAVYQTAPEETYHMQVQVRELHNMLEKNEDIVLKEDGTIEAPEVETSQKQPNSDGVIDISDDEDDGLQQNLMCKICKTRFSTQKTLKFHLKTKHLSSRLVYPCPDCTELFSTSWSVYRHLFRVHRKSLAQVRKLREWIQSKTFRMNKVPPFHEKKLHVQKLATLKAITPKNEQNEWVSNLERSDSSPRCGGCGRTFERRAALHAHHHTCQPRRALLKDTSKKPIRTHENTSTKDEKEDSAEEDLETVENVDNDDSCSSTSQNDNENDNQETIDNDTSPDYPEIEITKLTEFEKIEKRNYDALNKKMLLDVDIETILCKKCSRKFSNSELLLDHMAMHYNWNRYTCKLCPFKDYYFGKVSDHIRVVHKLNGDSLFYSRTINALEPSDALGPNCDSESPKNCQENDTKSTLDVTVLEPKRKRKCIKKKDKSELKDDENSADATSLRSEENSSDIDDLDNSNVFVASKRPVRKRPKPKNDDFEYDLSNLLKLEAHGYKETKEASNKITQSRKVKVLSLPPSPVFDDKDYSGSLMNLSKNAFEKGKAVMLQLKTSDTSPKNPNTISIFAKPWAKTKTSSPAKTEEKIEKVSLLKDSYILNDGTKVKLKSLETINSDANIKKPETNGLPKHHSEPIRIKVQKRNLDIIKNPLIKSNLTPGLLSKVVVLKKRLPKDGEGPAIKLKSDALKLLKIAQKPKVDNERIVIKDSINDNNSDNSVIPVTIDKAEDILESEKNNSESVANNT